MEVQVLQANVSPNLTAVVKLCHSGIALGWVELHEGERRHAINLALSRPLASLPRSFQAPLSSEAEADDRLINKILQRQMIESVRIAARPESLPQSVHEHRLMRRLVLLLTQGEHNVGMPPNLLDYVEAKPPPLTIEEVTLGVALNEPLCNLRRFEDDQVVWLP